MPSAPYFGISIQSPTWSMSLTESWIPDTKPRMLSLKISSRIAAEAPRPVRKIFGDLPISIETISTAPIIQTIPCAVCRSPLIGLFCHAGRCTAIRNAARINAQRATQTVTTK